MLEQTSLRGRRPRSVIVEHRPITTPHRQQPKPHRIEPMEAPWQVLRRCVRLIGYLSPSAGNGEAFVVAKSEILGAVIN
jgi:hypothetical protein